jgi:hypothetical protein
MITSYDDYPIHQTWEPIAHPESGDPGHYDRYFFNGYNEDGSLFFALAMGLYPNRHVMDAAFSVIVDGQQINLRTSARAAMDRKDCTHIGPIHLEIVEPMQRHKISVSSEEHRISAELEFVATSQPYEEPPFHVRTGNRTTMRYTRLTQLGYWSGRINIDGVEHRIDQTHFKGSRDRSWGVRGVGERTQFGAPAAHLPQFYWLWAPVCFNNFGTMFDVNEYSNGQRWHDSGAFLEGKDTVIHAHHVAYECQWQPGTRHMERFSLHYEFDKFTATLNFTPRVHFQMSGLGYLHREWGHGMWKGDIATTRDEFALPVSNPMNMEFIHVQSLSDVECVFSDGRDTQRGIGVLETLVLGAYSPAGFSGLSDGFEP